MDRNSTLQASLKARGPIFFNQSIELNKLNNFRSICVKKIFTSKKLWIKMFKKFVEIFSSIFGSRRASAPLEPQNWKWNHEDNYTLSTFTENFSLVAFIVFYFCKYFLNTYGTKVVKFIELYRLIKKNRPTDLKAHLESQISVHLNIFLMGNIL